MHNEEFRNLYVSPNIVRVIKLRKMRLARNVACKIWVRKPEGKRPLGLLNHKLNFGKWVEKFNVA
jgi:hypothetical protein